MSERGLRIAFFGFLGALLALAAASAYAATALGYVYGEAIRVALYPALAKGLAPLLAVAIAGAVVAGHALRLRADRVEHGLLRWMDTQGGWTPRAWDEDAEMALVEGVQTGQFGYDGATVQDALAERRRLLRERRWAVRLFGVPVAGLAVIAGFSLWAVPATGAFLQSQAVLNTAFAFFATYGLFLLLPALVVAFLLTFSE